MQECRQLQQQSEVSAVALLLSNLTAIDEVSLSYFIERYVPDPKHLFLRIVKQPIPYRKQQQENILILLAYSHYRLQLENLSSNQLNMITKCYRQYMIMSPFTPDLVKYHEKIVTWGNQLMRDRDLVMARKDVCVILGEIERSEERRLALLGWRLQLCIFVLDVTLRKVTLQRSKVVKFMKKFQQLKNNQKVTLKPTVEAFCYIITNLIRSKDDIYLFFEKELKQLKKQPLEEQSYMIIEQTFRKCEESATTKMFSAVQNYAMQKLPHHRPIPRKQKSKRKVFQNEEMNDQIFRKIDHFLKFRPTTQHQFKSPETSNRTSISLHSMTNPNIKTQVSLHQTTRLGWFKSVSKSRKNSRVSLNKTANFARRKRREVYRILQRQRDAENFTIGRVNLLDEMAEIGPLQIQRCKLSLDDILFGQITNNATNEKIESTKIVGSLEDRQFSSLKLTFFTIFNQEMAELQVQITKKQKSYFFSCWIRSTYCRHSVSFKTESETYITIEGLQKYVENSVIYYQAIQERVERKVTFRQLQELNILLMNQLGKQLSQEQLLKVLLAVDLAKSQFFWYYTKCSLLNGSRIQKRKNIQLQDQSAFAVCLSKFKSDYDSCLNELIQVENMRSLIENCHYLAHGRTLVYQELRNIEGELLLEVISISEEVYKSVKRRGKVPYFESTWLERYFIDLNKGRRRKVGAHRINLRQILKEEDAFIFLMKNIVQNFIQIKYVRKFSTYLQKLYQKENSVYFQVQNLQMAMDHHLQCLNNSEIFQTMCTKPNLAPSITNFRQFLLEYSKIYNLRLMFQIKNEKKYLFKVGNKSFFGQEIQLRNGLKMLKYYKSSSRKTFSLFVYHREPKQLVYLSTPFYNRIAFSLGDNLEVNLFRNSRAQPFMQKNSQVHKKMVIRLNGQYCYASVGQIESLQSWRLDLYLPQKQIHLSTFLDEELFIESSILTGEDTNTWKKTLEKAVLDLQFKQIVINSRKFKLFQVLRQAVISENTNQGEYFSSLELIDFENQLCSLGTHHQKGSLSLGKVDDIPFAYVSQLLSPNSTKARPGIYSSLMVRLCYQWNLGLVLFQYIQPEYFSHDLVK